MSCAQILHRLTTEFDNWSCESHRSCKEYEIVRRDRAYSVRAEFLRRFPFREQPSTIDALTAKGLYDPGAGNQYFFRDIVWTLRPLGGIGLRDVKPLEAAAGKIAKFRQLLRTAVDPGNTLAAKFEAGWDDISGFIHGDRVIVRKIVTTYFPERTIPVFNHADMEHFVEYLGHRDYRDRLALEMYGGDYSRLSAGQQWELLTDILIKSKDHLQTLRNQDNVYFMYCLYSGSSRPPRMGAWRGHTNGQPPTRKPRSVQLKDEHQHIEESDPVAAVAELQTGIKSGQRFCESAEARAAIDKHAMSRATEHLEANGWEVSNVSREKRGYDLHCDRRGEVLMVEVKGTTGDGGKVLLTPNEVLHARGRRPKVGLIVVSAISLSEIGEEITASGGEIRELKPWDVDRGVLAPLGYEYTLPVGPK